MVENCPVIFSDLTVFKAAHGGVKNLNQMNETL